MHRLQFRTRWQTTALLALLASGAALAQWDPGASQQLGMGHGFTALSQSTMRNAMQTDDDDDGVDGEAEAAPVQDAAARRARLDALAREYVQRVERDGRVDADAWAFERGRRDAQTGTD